MRTARDTETDQGRGTRHARVASREPRAGRVYWPGRLPAHRASTAHLQAAYPFIAAAGLGGRGIYIGRDCFGGSFCFDPFELYAAEVLTNPNMLVTGQVGSGKSSFVKSFLWRSQEFGRAAWVADPKGEYGDLAAACGVLPIKLGPGLPTRLNALELGAEDTDGAVDDSTVQRTESRRLRLVLALASAALDRPLTPAEHAAATLALTTATAGARRRTAVLPDLVTALLDPDPAGAAELRMSVRELAVASRDVALVMHRLCAGDLAGMFDAPTTPGLALDGALVVLDLSAVYSGHREALPLVMTCATAWLQAAITRAGASRRYVVIDEGWALLSSVGTARWLQASFKLSRGYGVSNIVVLHRFSDLTAAGDAGSEAVSLARGLLADAGTRVVYAQPHSEIPDARELLGLSSTEAGLLPHLPKGRALWSVGTRSFLVDHRRSPAEVAMTDTDAAMTGRSSS